MNRIVLIGNFVNDVILIHRDLHLEKDQSFQDIVSIEKQLSYGREETEAVLTENGVTRAQALGGSVTYGSIAAGTFGGAESFIITDLGNDILQPEFDRLIRGNGSISLKYSTTDLLTRNTSYYLNYYNNKKNRNLSLMEKGTCIDVKKCIECITNERPDAILLVPVSNELDEETVVTLANCISGIGGDYRPIVAFDIQGFLRSFSGNRVTTRPKHLMIQKLITISQALVRLGGISVVKAEYGEAAAIVGDQDPGTCARLIRENFGFSIVSVTMGGDGGFISTELTGEIYIPTFKPTKVTDETGCGDTFLTCTVLELLNTIKSKPKTTSQPLSEDFNLLKKNLLSDFSLTPEDILHCIRVGSAGASYLVEEMGPNGFGSRERIFERVKNGVQQIKQHYLQYMSPKNELIIPMFVEPSQTKPKIFKSITSYK